MGERKARSYRQCSIAERHLSPALRVFPPEALAIAPLTGIRALIYSRLWRPIADGRMKTGTPIAESELGEVFKVSRTVSRAVLEYMAAAGCLTISSYRRARVAEPTPAEAVAVFDMLGVTMRHVIGELADNVTSCDDGMANCNAWL